ncbi:MAG: hypothetical protein ACRELV_16775, partial [Longimicrobiales bacterium]
MRCIHSSTAALTALLLVAGAGELQAQDVNRSVENGGISVPGWEGAIDARAASSGQTVEDASLVMDGDALHVTTGPAVTYWNP